MNILKCVDRCNNLDSVNTILMVGIISPVELYK